MLMSFLIVSINDFKYSYWTPPDSSIISSSPTPPISAVNTDSCTSALSSSPSPSNNESSTITPFPPSPPSPSPSFSIIYNISLHNLAICSLDGINGSLGTDDTEAEVDRSGGTCDDVLIENSDVNGPATEDI